MTERKLGLGLVTAREQLAKSYPPHAGVQPLPAGSPGRVKGHDVGIEDASPITFFVIGDQGGVKDPKPQNAVSYAMQQASKPAFVYSVGDCVYFNGDPLEYAPQFYEAYAHLAVPIVGIPGNHDGDGTDGIPGSGIASFMANFCASSPGVPEADPQMEYGRHTQTQPYVDWTLDLKGLTIIGLYTNVPSGGHLEQSQIDWLAGELKDADSAKPLVVALHHPPFSVDAHHGGSAKMAKALNAAFASSGRSADLVLSGHVHDCQRFSVNHGGKTVPYVVCGNSGYHNLHKLAPDASRLRRRVVDGVTFEYGDDSRYGFWEITSDGSKLTGSYTAVTPGTMPDGSDATVETAQDSF